MYTVYSEELRRNRVMKSAQRMFVTVVMCVLPLIILGAIGLVFLAPAFEMVSIGLPEAPQIMR